MDRAKNGIFFTVLVCGSLLLASNDGFAFKIRKPQEGGGASPSAPVVPEQPAALPTPPPMMGSTNPAPPAPVPSPTGTGSVSDATNPENMVTKPSREPCFDAAEEREKHQAIWAELVEKRKTCECECYGRFIPHLSPPQPSATPSEDEFPVDASSYDLLAKNLREACLAACQSTFDGGSQDLFKKISYSFYGNGKDCKGSAALPTMAPPPPTEPASCPAPKAP